MEFAAVNKRVQKRYPMCFVKWNSERKCAEVWENYDGKIGKQTRHLWTYENPDGSKLPVEPSWVLEWLQKADTRNWSAANRDLFREIVEGRKKQKEKAEEELREAVGVRVGEDYNYIMGIKTFFMDPRSMPVSKTTHTPGQEKILKQDGLI